MSFSSSANLSCFPVCCGELCFNFLFDTGVFLLEIGFTGVFGVTFTGVCGIDGLSCWFNNSESGAGRTSVLS